MKELTNQALTSSKEFVFTEKINNLQMQRLIPIKHRKINFKRNKRNSKIPEVINLKSQTCLFVTSSLSLLDCATYHLSAIKDNTSRKSNFSTKKQQVDLLR